MKRYLVLALVIVFFSGCDHTYEDFDLGNCTDGIMNQGEEEVDCGGPCYPCADCTDGVMNGEEEGVDCGGSACTPCEAPCNNTMNYMYIEDYSLNYNASSPYCSSGVDSYTPSLNGTDLDVEFTIPFIPSQTGIYNTADYFDSFNNEASDIDILALVDVGWSAEYLHVNPGQNVYIEVTADSIKIDLCQVNFGSFMIGSTTINCVISGNLSCPRVFVLYM